MINEHSPSTVAAQTLITMSVGAHLEPHSETNWLLAAVTAAPVRAVGGVGSGERAHIHLAAGQPALNGRPKLLWDHTAWLIVGRAPLSRRAALCIGVNRRGARKESIRWWCYMVRVLFSSGPSQRKRVLTRSAVDSRALIAVKILERSKIKKTSDC